MKKLFFGLIALTLAFGLQAQDDGKKSLKEAKKVFGQFNLDQMGKRAALKDAITAIDQAVKGTETGASADTWLLRGDIYNSVATQVITIRSTSFGDEKELPELENPALVALEAYSKALELAEKKYHSKDALKGIQNVQGNLSNFGIYKFDEKNYAGAYDAFSSVLKCHEILKEKGQESSLDDAENMKYQHYLAGLAALSGEDMEHAKEHFEILYKENYDKAAIYEALYKIYAEDDAEGAYQYLEKGRQKYPDETSLLFAEINHFLKLQQLETLIEKLKMAIEKEPDNLSVYSTLGNVYDQLYQKEYQAEEINHPKADEYFDSALKYYNDALEKDQKNFDATYSIGALYYNRAAIFAKLMNDEADNKKYEELRKKLLSQFDQALPFFQKAEQLNPNDQNTLIALKEIYAKKDDFEMSGVFKDRLEKVQGGEKMDKSYFNQ